MNNIQPLEVVMLMTWQRERERERTGGVGMNDIHFTLVIALTNSRSLNQFCYQINFLISNLRATYYFMHFLLDESLEFTLTYNNFLWLRVRGIYVNSSIVDERDSSTCPFQIQGQFIQTRSCQAITGVLMLFPELSNLFQALRQQCVFFTFLMNVLYVDTMNSWPFPLATSVCVYINGCILQGVQCLALCLRTEMPIVNQLVKNDQLVTYCEIGKKNVRLLVGVKYVLSTTRCWIFHYCSWF